MANTMTYEQRLWGICQMIDENRKEDDPDFEMTWQVQPARQWTGLEHLGDSPAARIEVGDEAYRLIWHTQGSKLGIIEWDQLPPYLDNPPGLIIHMKILAAANPAGDFQICEALEAVI